MSEVLQRKRYIGFNAARVESGLESSVQWNIVQRENKERKAKGRPPIGRDGNLYDHADLFAAIANQRRVDPSTKRIRDAAVELKVKETVLARLCRKYDGENCPPLGFVLKVTTIYERAGKLKARLVPVTALSKKMRDKCAKRFKAIRRAASPRTRTRLTWSEVLEIAAENGIDHKRLRKILAGLVPKKEWRFAIDDRLRGSVTYPLDEFRRRLKKYTTRRKTAQQDAKDARKRGLKPFEEVCRQIKRSASAIRCFMLRHPKAIYSESIPTINKAGQVRDMVWLSFKQARKAARRIRQTNSSSKSPRTFSTEEGQWRPRWSAAEFLNRSPLWLWGVDSGRIVIPGFDKLRKKKFPKICGSTWCYPEFGDSGLEKLKSLLGGRKNLMIPKDPSTGFQLLREFAKRIGESKGTVRNYQRGKPAPEGLHIEFKRIPCIGAHGGKAWAARLVSQDNRPLSPEQVVDVLAALQDVHETSGATLMKCGVAANKLLPAPSSSKLAVTTPVKLAPKGISWRDAKVTAEKHCRRNPFPGQNALAKIVGCSQSTMHKVMKNSPKLRVKLAEHEAQHQGVSAEAMTVVVAASTPQKREPDPVDAASATTDDIFQRLLEQAKPEEREQLMALNTDRRRKLISTIESDPESLKVALGR